MYDYEFLPQKDKPFAKVLTNLYKCSQECDALILTATYAYESVASVTVTLDAVKQWFSDIQKEAYFPGPLLLGKMALNKPLYRNGFTPAAGSREAVGIEVPQIIDLCRSEKGREVRNNAEKLKVEFAKAWEEDGAAKQEIREILRKYA